MACVDEGSNAGVPTTHHRKEAWQIWLSAGDSNVCTKSDWIPTNLKAKNEVGMETRIQAQLTLKERLWAQLLKNEFGA